MTVVEHEWVDVDDLVRAIEGEPYGDFLFTHRVDNVTYYWFEKHIMTEAKLQEIYKADRTPHYERKDEEPKPTREHLHIYKWRAETSSMSCDCGKPIPTGSKVIWK